MAEMPKIEVEFDVAFPADWSRDQVEKFKADMTRMSNKPAPIDHCLGVAVRSEFRSRTVAEPPIAPFGWGLWFDAPAGLDYEASGGWCYGDATYKTHEDALAAVAMAEKFQEGKPHPAVYSARPHDKLMDGPVWTRCADKLGLMFVGHDDYVLPPQKRANALADECQTLRDENTRLLAENARLRRRLDK
jgi:hypothetical protein